MTLRDKIFSFDGRLRRQDYWGISIALGLMVFALTEIVMFAVFGPDYCLFTSGLAAVDRRAADGWPYAVQTLISATTIWPNLAMSAKRAHDRDKSAKLIVTLLVILWLYTFAQVPLTGWMATLATTPSGMAVYVGISLLSLAVSLYTFVVIGCLDGTAGPNRFGPSPKARGLGHPS